MVSALLRSPSGAAQASNLATPEILPFKPADGQCALQRGSDGGGGLERTGDPRALDAWAADVRLRGVAAGQRLTGDALAHALLTPEISCRLSQADRAQLLDRFCEEARAPHNRASAARAAGAGAAAGAAAAGGVGASLMQAGAALGCVEGVLIGQGLAVVAGTSPALVPLYGLVGALTGAATLPLLTPALVLTAAVSGGAAMVAGSRTYLARRTSQAQQRLLGDVLRLHLELERGDRMLEDGQRRLAALRAAICRTTWTAAGARQLTAWQAALRVEQLLTSSLEARDRGGPPLSS